jgi:hypothetical protein
VQWPSDRPGCLEEIELNVDASFQQILTSELKILWEAQSTPTLAVILQYIICKMNAKSSQRDVICQNENNENALRSP